jgi:integrase
MAKVFKKYITRYRQDDGKAVPKGTPSSGKVVERSRKWYGRVAGKAVPLSPNKGVAEQLLNKLRLEAERAKAGLVDEFAEGRQLPLDQHLDDWRADLRARGNTEHYVDQIWARASWVVQYHPFEHVKDITPSDVLAALAELRDGEGRSVQTCNHYLLAIKQFCRWLVRDKRMPSNPLAHLPAGNVKTDRRHDHHHLLTGELTAVLGAARASDDVIRGLDGEDRFALYLAASRTGFRAKELASLTPESFRLDDAPPVAILAARKGKNRKLVRQPLPPDLVAVMRVYLKSKPAGEPVWPGGWWRKAAEVLAIDLAAAGIDYEVIGPDGDAYRDFHGLRATYITSLEAAGVSVKTAQELARHGDVRLTLGLYTRKTLHDLGAAVEQLPPVLPKMLPTGADEPGQNRAGHGKETRGTGEG